MCHKWLLNCLIARRTATLAILSFLVFGLFLHQLPRHHGKGFHKRVVYFQLIKVSRSEVCWKWPNIFCKENKQITKQNSKIKLLTMQVLTKKNTFSELYISIKIRCPTELNWAVHLFTPYIPGLCIHLQFRMHSAQPLLGRTWRVI